MGEKNQGEGKEKLVEQGGKRRRDSQSLAKIPELRLKIAPACGQGPGTKSIRFPLEEGAKALSREKPKKKKARVHICQFWGGGLYTKKGKKYEGRENFAIEENIQMAFVSGGRGGGGVSLPSLKNLRPSISIDSEEGEGNQKGDRDCKKKK